ncbi:50S ribosomal protein L6 [Candidatus Babeliales bacterium]|nr:50S ribosomal protein L6 [Candidatus Babeliales bacterium]
MSKIGRLPISFTSATVKADGNGLEINGPKATVKHKLPRELKVEVVDKEIRVIPVNAKPSRQCNMLWGLHRALIANKVYGVQTGFQQAVKIVGLGYKAIQKGNSLTFSLGYSHTIEFSLPDIVTVDIDKSGQNLVFKSIDKFELGNVCSAVRALRPPEPYKGTGIMLDGEKIIRKAGKAKA